EAGDEDLDQLMNFGIGAMRAGQFGPVLNSFNAIIDADPAFAEGWNKRATVLYLAEAYDRSIQDIKETLRREPRHFGALSGLGLIFLHQRQYAPAANAFRNALAINPHLPRIRRALDQLEQRQRAVDEENTI
ncbi:MAG: tetratricopeptide repeat protein, partial [Alphaproteobacteria bacterium]|nr:tetratricopeptide repeat protein [Alphaproteobacteria bacterium]